MTSATKPTCSSFHARITNDTSSVVFSCPSCGKSEIVRSGKARAIVAKYKCHACGFEGPN